MEKNKVKPKLNNGGKKEDNKTFSPQTNTLPFRLGSVRGLRKGNFPAISKLSKNNVNNININEEPYINIAQKTFTFDDIIFTSEFNSGNMKQCTQINENEYSILIALDCEGKTLSKTISNYKIWFYFGVKSMKEKNIKISIDNLNNFYKIFKNGYKIVYNELKLGETPSEFQNNYNENEEDNWKRLNEEYDISLDEKTNLLSIKFNYNLPENKYVLFAFCFPWSYEKNEAYLNYIKNNYNNQINEINLYYHDEILTLSKENRKIHLSLFLYN